MAKLTTPDIGNAEEKNTGFESEQTVLTWESLKERFTKGDYYKLQEGENRLAVNLSIPPIEDKRKFEEGVRVSYIIEALVKGEARRVRVPLIVAEAISNMLSEAQDGFLHVKILRKGQGRQTRYMTLLDVNPPAENVAAVKKYKQAKGGVE